MNRAPAGPELADGTRRARPTLRGVLLSIVELPLALLFAYSVMIAVAWLGCKVAAQRCVDLSGIPWYLGGLACGLFLAAFYWGRAFRMRGALRRRLLLDLAVLVLAVAPFVIAWTSDTLREREAAASKVPPAPRIVK